MTIRNRYVVGFAFDPSREFVLLLRKNHPEWQRGKLNGLGGHCEPDEVFVEAMIREGMEETGRRARWHQFAVLRGPDWSMGCFRAEPDWMVGDVPKRNDVGEEFVIRPVFTVAHPPSEMEDDFIPNLRWLIPMALAARLDNGAHTVRLH